jgi:hypothetical protein
VLATEAEHLKFLGINLCYRFADRITVHIPAAIQPMFEDEVRSRMHDEFRYPPPSALALSALEEVDSMSSNRRATIEALGDRYHATRRTLDRAIVRVHRRRAETWPWNDDDVAVGVARNEAARLEAQEHPERFLGPSAEDMKPWRERYRFERATCRELRRIFSDEEFEALAADVRLLLSWAALPR